MFIVQCILIAALCSISGNAFPFAGGSGGWYTLGRPLIGGTLCGLILGDVKAGVEIGIAVQLVYLALVTPGGTIGTDISFVAYPAIAIAILAKMDAGSAIALASTIGILGTFTFQLAWTVRSFYTSYVEQALKEKAYGKFVFRYWVWPNALYIAVRFIPAFIAVYFGSQYIAEFMEMLPAFAMNAMSALGGILPAVGIAVLLSTSVREKSYIIYFLIGFVFVVFMNVNIIALTILAAGIAYMYYIASAKGEQGAAEMIEEEEVL